MKKLGICCNQILLFVMLVITSCFMMAYADTPNSNTLCSLSSTNGILDSILRDYYNGSHQWQTTLAPIALTMYWFWFTCEFLWQLSVKKVMGNDISKLYYWAIVRIFSAQLFAYIFVNPSFYIGIIEYFTNLGAQAGGFTVTLDSSNPFATFSPSGIMNTGTCLFDNMMAFLNNNSGGISNMFKAVAFAMPMMLTVIGVYLLSALMALALLLTALEGYIVMNAGIILCGFAGASWTQSFWQKYLSYVGGVAIRLFVMCLILGLMKANLMLQFATIMQLNVLTDFGVAWGILIKIAISMFIYAFLILKVPSMAGAMLSGTVNSSLGDVIAGASMVMSGASLSAVLGGRAVGGGQSVRTNDFAKQILEGSGKLTTGAATGGASMAADTATKAATQTASQTAKLAQAQTGKADALNPKNAKSEAEKPNFADYMKDRMSKIENVGGGTNNVSGKNDTAGNLSGSKAQAVIDNQSNVITNSMDGGTNSNIPTQEYKSKNFDAAKHFGNIGKKASDLAGGGHSGSAEVNVNLHKE